MNTQVCPSENTATCSDNLRRLKTPRINSDEMRQFDETYPLRSLDDSSSLSKQRPQENTNTKSGAT